ncbi:LOW QUALITY PROTEIN: putative E3 ubiquitin-protein ligase UBR7 [Pomacea canaliculata]|uniref:LOW QUALITY PROTEIN: putative E3 ubiquitin-protein ligase UBR7 n=1 Tax=Pomacea canaliculata TaxID=400727 RepID=UPI000D725E52|nr:LOW QUALITY PROTEIN: putative E3 ubiquitin-protein ligase UBR7 [Pomacea canaliculata]
MSAENPNIVDDDDSLSLVDVLNEQARLQADASAVLGDSDESNCTYAKGYIQRQALYACATCSSTEPAGICLACSYQCHEGHELYELYTKRFFRCDCGNSKFPESLCKLEKAKDPVNIQNKYSQNFRGVYCTCARPYPDPEDEIEDEMIQCVICEDWFHGRHLNATVPEDFHEMICTCCMDKHSFLWAYQVDSPITELKKEEADIKVEVGLERREQISSETSSTMSNDVTANIFENTCVSSEEETKIEESEPMSKRLKRETQRESELKKEIDGESECILKDLQQHLLSPKHCGTFWERTLETKLCRCAECKKLYEEEGVSFLLDPKDTVQAYEERGKMKTPCMSEIDLERRALSQMNRVQQVELLQGFMDLKTELQEFLKGFASSGRVVAEEDIRGFFSRMEAKRRERNFVPQYFCK